MNEIKQFIQATILLFILFVYSVFFTNTTYILIFFSGALLFVFTRKSLSEDKYSILLLTMQAVFSFGFIIVAQNPFAYLICYEFRLKKYVNVIISPMVYFIFQSILNEQNLAITLGNTFLIFFISCLIAIADYLITNYLSAKEKIRHAYSVSAVNEMYEKKLNHELIIKNYLTDKTARLEERENISRNIHNNVGHSITAAIMTLDAANMLFDSDPDKAREKMNTANQRIHTSLASIRQAVRILDNETSLINIEDFRDELKTEIDAFMMDTTIQIVTDFDKTQNDVLIPREHTEFLTGAMKELLTNGVRHGNADSFIVRTTTDSKHIKLQVCDNGTSDFSIENQAERIKNGFGLKKLLSYVKRCGGNITFSNDTGFKTEITLPIIKEDDYENSTDIIS